MSYALNKDNVILKVFVNIIYAYLIVEKTEIYTKQLMMVRVKMYYASSV